MITTLAQRRASKKWNKKAYNANPEKYREISRMYRFNNKEKVRLYNKKWYTENREKGIAASVRWSRNHPERRKLYRVRSRATSRRYENQLYKNDLNFRIAKVLRSRLATALRRSIKNNVKRGVSAVKDLGCTIPELKVYLENQFQPGMSWDNWECEGWHIDHRIPFAFFDLSDEKQVAKVCHYTNLKPMWGIENLKKGKKIDFKSSSY
jgi:hypothetical protein